MVVVNAGYRVVTAWIVQAVKLFVCCSRVFLGDHCCKNVPPPAFLAKRDKNIANKTIANFSLYCYHLPFWFWHFPSLLFINLDCLEHGYNHLVIYAFQFFKSFTNISSISSISNGGNIILQFWKCTTITWLDPNLVASGFFFPMGRIVYPVLFFRTKPIFSVRLSSFLLLLNPYFSVQSTLKGSDRLFAKYTVREHAAKQRYLFLCA